MPVHYLPPDEEDRGPGHMLHGGGIVGTVQGWDQPDVVHCIESDPMTPERVRTLQPFVKLVLHFEVHHHYDGIAGSEIVEIHKCKWCQTYVTRGLRDRWSR